MHTFVTAPIALLIGTLLLMAGILISKEPYQSMHDALKESLAWGSGFFLTFAFDLFLLSNI